MSAGRVRVTLDRERGPGPGRPARRLHAAWARSQHVMAETRMLAGMLAATEDRVAATLARMAERIPARGDRLRQLSEDARREANRLRDRAQLSGTPAARRGDGGDRNPGAGPGAGPARARMTPAESGPVLVLAGEAEMRSSGTREDRASPDAVAQAGHDVVMVSENRNCQQCGAVFLPRREHARFCSSSCRDSWNRQRGGDAVTEASALRWTVTAMRNVNESLAAAGAQDRSQAFEAISEAVWWVTMVDATLNRHHLEAYESVMHAQPVAERQLVEGILAGLRFVRNQMGYHIGQADFIQPAHDRSGGDGGPITAWSWRSLPKPGLAWLPPRGQAWETTRYHAYQAQLAGHSIGEIFGQAAAFLKLASARATRHA